MNDNLVIADTPWEKYYIGDRIIYVKREDLSCPLPGPSFSKIRGVAAFLEGIDVPAVGVLDTYHSKAGWGVAYICKRLGITCYNFYPVYKREGSLDSHDLRVNQINAKTLGALLVPLKAGRSAILHHQARKLLAELTDSTAILLPNALKLDESVEATAKEVKKHTPAELLDAGTWVVSISSGTIAAGVVSGLKPYQSELEIYAHMGYSRSTDQAGQYIMDKAGYEPDNLWLVDEGYSYKDSVEYPCPFPCNKYYDLKAWKWLIENLDDLVDPIVFWNIGD